MKIFVSGANGFVGQHLVQHLIRAGHEVTAGVRSAGTAPHGTREVAVGDIGPDTDWTTALVNQDVVIHLAARVHVMNDTADDPLTEFRRVNTAGTTRLALCALEHSVGRLVFLSSIKVNGEATSGSPFTAHDAPNPSDPYGVSKHEAEVALRKVERELGLDVVIVRTPLVYGPHVRGNFIRLLKLAKAGVPLPFGSLRNRRTMASVWNLCDLLERASSDSAAEGATVLAADAQSASTAQLVAALRIEMGKKPRIFRFPMGLLRLVGRVSGASSTIDRLAGSLEVEAGSSTTAWEWKPPMSFERGIQQTVRWFNAGDIAQ